MSLSKFNEPALLALGLDRATVGALAHLLKQVGAKTGGETLPSVAAQADQIEQALSLLKLALDTVRALAGELEANQAASAMGGSDRSMRGIDELLAALERAGIEQHATRQRMAEFEADMQALHLTNNQLSRRIADLENGAS